MVLPIIAAVAGGLIAARGASKSARTQSRAARDAADAQLTGVRETNQMMRDFRNQDVARFQPWMAAGQNALAQYQQGIDQGFNFDFQADPGYQFRLNEGQRMLEGSAAAAGNLYSGNTLRALTDYGQGMASNEYGNYIARLGSLAGIGQAAAGNQANAGANFAAGAGQAIAGLGNAQAAGAIGGGNAINQGIGNALGAWQYAQQSAGGNTAPNWLFNPGGGGSWMNGMFS